MLTSQTFETYRCSPKYFSPHQRFFCQTKPYTTPISNMRFVCCRQTIVCCHQIIVCRQQTKEGSSYIVSKYAKQQSKAGRFSSCSASTDNAFQPLATIGKHKVDQKRRKALVASVLCYKGLCWVNMHRCSQCANNLQIQVIYGLGRGGMGGGVTRLGASSFAFGRGRDLFGRRRRLLVCSVGRSPWAETGFCFCPSPSLCFTPAGLRLSRRLWSCCSRCLADAERRCALPRHSPEVAVGFSGGVSPSGSASRGNSLPKSCSILRKA